MSTKFLRVYLCVFVVIMLAVIVVVIRWPDDHPAASMHGKSTAYEWEAPDSIRIPATAEGEMIRYGMDLIANTSHYFGPKGSVAPISNGMNCQNCHLAAGTKYGGNNFSAVYATYPKFRPRSGTIESVYKKVNDCFERSLNGKSIDTASREMQAIYTYIKWLGKDVPKQVKPAGSGIASLPFLERAADPNAGRQIYMQRCQRCHGSNGAGLLSKTGIGYEYPPLWGPDSYTTAAGLFRLSRFAGYVRYNMPFDSKPDSAALTDEEAWDVAAFVNSQPRPERTYKEDWPDISLKPFDHPFGPYADSFDERTHKYGPFGKMRQPGKKGQ